MSYTGITLCSGGGLAALGLQAAGVHLVGAVEYDPAIAAVYSANLGDHCTVAPVQDVDYAQWRGVNVLQVSPPCPSFSVAKTGGVETDLDTAIAAAIVRAITTIRPRVLWLENVEGYAASASYRAIRAALDSLDYWSHAAVVNSADMGVPQTRRRLILRAVAGGWMQPFRPLPAPVPWVGWYAAIADLLSTLPESAFADWQLKRLPAELTASFATAGDLADPASKAVRRLATYAVHEPYPAVTASIMHRTPAAFLMNTSADKWCDGLRTAAEPAATIRTGMQHLPRAFVVSNSKTEWSDGIRQADEPMLSVTTQTAGRARAFVVSGHSDLAIRAAAEPMVTLTATDTTNTIHRAWLDYGRVVKLTPRALARFQSVPDAYQLPAGAALACRIVGNGVPVLVSQVVTESLLDVAGVAA